MTSSKKHRSQLKNSNPPPKKFSLIQTIFLQLRRNWIFIISIIIYATFFLSVVRFGSFTDEHEHFATGWFISQGLLPYKDFFSHHAPLPIFLSVVPFLFFKPQPETIHFLRIIVLSFQIGVWMLLWKFIEPKYRPVVTGLMIVTGFLLPVFNLQMFLSTTFVAFSLLCLTCLVLQHLALGKPNQRTIILSFGIFFFISFWSSIASFIPLAFLGLLLLIHWLKKKQLQKFFKQQKAILLATSLQLVFPVFFLLQKSFQAFWWSVFTYNSQYYFPLHLAQNDAEKKYGPLFRQVRGFFDSFFSEINTIISTIKIFIQSLLGTRLLLQQSKSLNEIVNYFQLIFTEFSNQFFSISTMMVFGIFVTTILLTVIKKSYGFIFFLLSFGFWFRDNELFHLSPVIMWLIAGILFCIYYFWQQNQKFLFLFSGICFFCLFYPMLIERHKFFNQHQPVVPTHISEQAQVIAQLTKDPQSVLIFSADFLSYPLARRFPASPHYFYFPWIAAAPQIHQQYTQTIEQQKAQLIVTDKEFEETEIELMRSVNEKYMQLERNNFYIKN